MFKQFNVRSVLAIMLVLLSYIVLFILLNKPVPPENKDLVNVTIGFIIGSGVSGVVGYYYVSSKGQEPPKTDNP